MKAIIDGKRYNTETAEDIATWSNGYSYSDFNRCDESLYRTPKGAWFLHGGGGPMSKYAKSCGTNQTRGSIAITPLSEADAYGWLEERGYVAEIEAYFPKRIEDA